MELNAYPTPPGVSETELRPVGVYLKGNTKVYVFELISDPCVIYEYDVSKRFGGPWSMTRFSSDVEDKNPYAPKQAQGCRHCGR